nr:YifB family Mg chelatase-like AAA ATPase [uncultured Sellimonas sp.]
MGFAMVKSAVMDGLTVREVCVEADTGSGLPIFHMVGYLSSEVKEAGERVRTAIRHTRARLQPQRMVVNLSPADIRKTGASFDLPIAVALALSAACIACRCEKKLLFIGELSLDAKVRKVKGILPIVSFAREHGFEICIVPWENEAEGKLAEGIEVIGVSTLSEVWDFLEDGIRPPRRVYARKETPAPEEDLDFSEIKGQSGLRRASEVAAAGCHNILYIGPPGSGKTMAAQRLRTLLPDMDEKTSMETTTIYSTAGLLDEVSPLLKRPPYREVHHTVTKAALLGGGRDPSAGELSLAHGGILFLDELSEYQRSVLDALREPLETRQVRITRKKGTYLFPADVLVAAAMNPCPCGYYPDLERCRCTPGEIHRYLSKVSQPFLDRMDICVETPCVSYQELVNRKKEETSEQIRARVVQAREIQKKRYRNCGILKNSQMRRQEIETYCCLEGKEKQMMEHAFDRLGLTARTYYKILKVARTIADLDDSVRIKTCHLAEAVSYRMVDQTIWGNQKR